MLYDFGCTSFVVVVITFVWGLYFKRIVVGGPMGDLLWGASGAISTVVVAAAAPLLGAAADEAGLRSRFLVVFSVLALLAGACLGAVGPGAVAAGMALFVLANSAFQIAAVFFNAFLPELAPPERLSRISGYGWAAGYAGAIFTVVVLSPLLAGGIRPENIARLRLAFPAQAAIYLTFALPAFLVFRDGAARPPSGLLAAGLARLRGTWRSVRALRRMSWFLAAYVLYNDGINTVLYFSMIYAADTLGFTARELITLYLVVQGTGIVGAVAFGWVGDHLGIKPTLAVTLVLWLAVITGAYLAESRQTFLGVAAAAGCLIGSTQALSRAMMALLIPAGRTNEFFSFYGVSGRVSAALGPLVFGLVSYATGSQRPAILSIAAFFLAGLALLAKVEAPEGRPHAALVDP